MLPFLDNASNEKTFRKRTINETEWVLYQNLEKGTKTISLNNVDLEQPNRISG